MLSTLLFEAVDFAYTVGRVFVHITGSIISYYSSSKKQIVYVERKIIDLEEGKAKLI